MREIDHVDYLKIPHYARNDKCGLFRASLSSKTYSSIKRNRGLFYCLYNKQPVAEGGRSTRLDSWFMGFEVVPQNWTGC